ncbi:hypothetical protein [Streptomyces sp. NPDC093269]|uniref:hypothetical protein n=1 Tax=Streptomyces sp. NPDC093269 TaxID=3366038 RepID=UPI003811FDA5
MAQHPAEGRREAVCAWLTANGIDPKNVPQDADITISEGAGGRVISCEVFDLDPDGLRQIDERGNRAAVTVVTVPLKVEPPTWWKPYQKPTSDQLSDAIKTAFPALRRALADLPAVCRYHGENPAPRSPSYGREACCDTGEPAMRRRKAEEALRALVAHVD